MERLETSPAAVSVREAAEQFDPFDGRAWFNTAHQGPVPQSGSPRRSGSVAEGGAVPDR